MNFEKFFEPTSVKECCALLAEYGADAKLLAGGTDLVPRMKAKTLQPKVVISLHKIPGIADVTVDKAGATIGACKALRDLSKDDKLNAWPALQAAAGHVSSMQIRNVATLGGNACNASPSADAVEGLMIYGATVNIVGPNGERKLPIEQFFKGPGKTDLKPGELVVSFFVPTPEAGSGADYKKFAIRGDTDISIVGAGAYIAVKNGKIANARLSFASVAPTPLRVPEAEQYLLGKEPTETVAREAAKIARTHVKPISDPRASAEYRSEMVEVWAVHAIMDAVKAIG